MKRLGKLVEFTGFGNGKGHVSFNKMVTFTALQTFVFAVLTRREPTWALLSFGVIVIGAGFGIRGYLASVKQNTLAASHAAQTNVTLTTTLQADLVELAKVVAGRRNAAEGFEDSE